MGMTWSPASADVYTEVSGTMVFNDDDVQWVYVDWGDGEDNSLEYAINQWEKLETDANSITLDHTYTKEGTFYPVLRTINSAGFVSKYLYSGGTVTNLPKPNEEVTNITGMAISDGNPTSVMRVENKQVLSGIDNNIFEEGSKDIYIMVPPLLSDAEKALMQSCTLEITGVMDAVIYNDAPSVSWNDEELGGERLVITRQLDIDIGGTSPSSAPAAQIFPLIGGMFSQILEVKWKNPKFVTDNKTYVNNYNKLKVFLIAKSNDGNWYPITYVSNGDPVKSNDEVKRNVTLDFSQSRARASNKSISYYKYDSGKVWWEPNFQWQQSSSTKLNDNTKTTDSIIKKGYTYYTQPNGLMGSGSITGEKTVGFYSGNAWSYGTGVGVTNKYLRDQFPINDFNQFYDQYNLSRVEAVSDSTKYSGLESFQTVYRIRPTVVPSGLAGYYLTGPGSGLAPDETNIHTSGSWLNASGNAINTTSWNKWDFLESDDSSSRIASEYFIVSNASKFGKIFINNTMYSPEMESNLAYNSGSNIAGVYYLRVTNEKAEDQFTQKAEWVPLRFEDTTKIEKEYRDSDNSTYVTKSNTMSRSGYVQYDIPDDWYNVTTISGLTGGFFQNTTDVKGENSSWSKLVTGDYGGVNSNGEWGEFIITGVTGLSNYTNEEIGRYRYVYHINSASNSADDGKVFWVSSGNVSTSKLYLTSGADASFSTPIASPINSGYMRRINIYDVFDGASKVSNLGLVPGYINPQMPTLKWDYTFMFNSGTALGTGGQLMATDIKHNFTGYPLKIVVSGASNHFLSGSTQPGWQPWNMFPITKADSQIIVQKDNTAYDLTYLEITSDVAISYAGTYYQAISKNGKVFVVRTGTPIQSISFGGTALGDETQFKFNDDFTSYGTLRLLRRMQSESTRIMWDEVQKDGTYVRFFGYVTQVSQGHSIGGPRAPMSYTFSMLVEEICLMDNSGVLMSDVIPLGGIKDAANFK